MDTPRSSSASGRNGLGVGLGVRVTDGVGELEGVTMLLAVAATETEGHGDPLLSSVTPGAVGDELAASDTDKHAEGDPASEAVSDDEGAGEALLQTLAMPEDDAHRDTLGDGDALCDADAAAVEERDTPALIESVAAEEAVGEREGERDTAGVRLALVEGEMLTAVETVALRDADGAGGVTSAVADGSSDVEARVLGEGVAVMVLDPSRVTLKHTLVEKLPTELGDSLESGEVEERGEGCELAVSEPRRLREPAALRLMDGDGDAEKVTNGDADSDGEGDGDRITELDCAGEEETEAVHGTDAEANGLDVEYTLTEGRDDDDNVTLSRELVAAALGEATRLNDRIDEGETLCEPEPDATPDKDTPLGVRALLALNVTNETLDSAEAEAQDESLKDG